MSFGTFPEYLFQVFAEYHFPFQKYLGQFFMLFFVFGQYLFSSFILLSYKQFNFLINNFCGFFTVRFLKSIFILPRRIKKAYVAKHFVHAEICNHGISLFGNFFKVVERTGTYGPQHKLFSGPASKSRAHLIQYLLRCGELSLFGQIPCCPQGFASRHDSNLDQRVGILEQPAYGCMPRLVIGNGFSFIFGNNLVFLFQPPDNPVNSIQKILLLNQILTFPGSYQGSFVTHISYVGP